MKYVGQKSLSRWLLVALTVLDTVLKVVLFIIAVAIVATLLGVKLPASSVLQLKVPGLVIDFTAPLESSISQSWLTMMLGTVALPAAATLLYIVRLLRQIFRTLIIERPFLAENATRVHRIGLALMVLAVVQWVGSILAGSFIARNVHLVGVTLTARLDPDLKLVFFGVLVLILAEVFRRGAELQDDHDLTV